MSDGGEVRLARDGVRKGWVGLGAFVAAYGVAVVCAVAGVLPPVFLVNLAYPFVFVGGTLVLLLTRHGADTVVVTREHLSVEGRAGPHRWAWGDLLEVGASATSGVIPYLAPGLTVLIRPEGRAWATPGPNMPLAVALPVFGREAQARAVDALRRACAEHGVPFNEKGLRMAEQPRPGSSMRTDRTEPG